jgi:hypothetical protein
MATCLYLWPLRCPTSSVQSAVLFPIATCLLREICLSTRTDQTRLGRHAQSAQSRLSPDFYLNAKARVAVQYTPPVQCNIKPNMIPSQHAPQVQTAKIDKLIMTSHSCISEISSVIPLFLWIKVPRRGAPARGASAAAGTNH